MHYNRYFHNGTTEDISFAGSFDNDTRTFNQEHSSFIALESGIQALSREKRDKEKSPIHNLHYKYLPVGHRPSEFGQAQVQKKRYQKSQHDCEEAGDGRSGRGSMEQISKKIQYILSSIEEEQRRESKITQEIGFGLPQKYSHISSKMTESIGQSRFDVVRERETFRTPSRQKVERRFDYSSGFNKVEQHSNMSQIETENRLRTPLGPQVAYTNRLEGTSGKITHFKGPYQGTRESVYSNLSMPKSAGRSVNKDSTLRGRNINEDIDRIQSKIQSINKIKENVNIHSKQHYSPLRSMQVVERMKAREPLKETQLSNLTFKSAEKNSALQTSYSKLTKTNRSQMEDLNSESKIRGLIDVPQTITKSCLFSERTIVQSVQDVGIPKILKKVAAKKKNKQLHQQNSLMATSCLITASFQKNKQNNQQSVHKNAEKFDTFRVKGGSIVRNRQSSFGGSTSQLGLQDVSGAVEFKRFLMYVESQIKLDQQFRKIKQWFHRLKVATKWQDLEIYYYRYQPQQREGYPLRSLKSIFSIKPEQQNPFYLPSQSDHSYEQLVRAYSTCENSWKAQISHQFDFLKLQKSGLKESNLDIRKKGCLNIEDLSRFLNAELDTFYRNRDIYLIYHRFKGNDKLFFRDIAECLQKG